jgi:hypothetical protein
VPPEEGQRPRWPTIGKAGTRRHAVSIGARAWRLGRLILVNGRGTFPAPAVTAVGVVALGVPAVAARNNARSD